MDLINEQQEVCEKYRAPFVKADLQLKIGISRDFQKDNWPINGLRHPLEGDTTGWYIWSGEEFSDKSDFFVPLHVDHLKEICPSVLKYLGLAPGWRFLYADNYEDVWEDNSLLLIDEDE